MTRLRMAVVGMGDIGRYVAGFLRWDPLFAPAAVVDTNEERARAGARRFRFGSWTTDYASVLEDPAVDAVHLAVPHAFHHEMLLAAIEAGKPVLCEKPITIRVDHADEVVRAAVAADVKVAVNYQYRYDRRAAKMIALARAGAIGNLLFARCLVPWRRSADYFTASAWHASLEVAGGGTLLTQASHALDLALLAANSEPVEAWGWNRRHCFPDVEVEDTAAGQIRLESGAIVQVATTMCAGAQRGLSVELVGDRGTICYHADPGRRLAVQGVSRAKRRVVMGSERAVYLRSVKRGVHPLQRSLRAFRSWVLGGADPATTAESAIPVLRAVAGCYESASGGSVCVPIGRAGSTTSEVASD